MLKKYQFKTVKTLLIVAGLFWLSFHQNLFADNPPYSLPGTEVFSIYSDVIDRHYDIYIRFPRNYQADSASKYPMVFLTDGRYAFPLVSSIVQQLSGGRHIQEPIVVGISFSKEDTWQVSRTRDYTPTHSPAEKNYHSLAARKASGGANQFIKFLQVELLPVLLEKYNIDKEKTLYAGHSFGGLLGTYIVKTQPDLFKYYLISDPSLWYDDRVVVKMATPPGLMNSVSGVAIVAAKPTPNAVEGELKMRSNAQDVIRQLNEKTDDEAKAVYHEVIGEVHESIFPVAISYGLRRFFPN